MDGQEALGQTRFSEQQIQGYRATGPREHPRRSTRRPFALPADRQQCRSATSGKAAWPGGRPFARDHPAPRLCRVGPTFLSAGLGDFPVAHPHAGQECPVNRQAGKPALRPGRDRQPAASLSDPFPERAWLHRRVCRSSPALLRQRSAALGEPMRQLPYRPPPRQSGVCLPLAAVHTVR